MAGGAVYIRVERPEGYDDVHPQLVAEDFVRAAGRGFAWEVAAPPRPDPVAWRVRRSDGQYELFFNRDTAARRAECFIPASDVEPLFAAPPQPAVEARPIAKIHADGYWTHEPGRDPFAPEGPNKGRASLAVYAAPPQR